MTRKFDRLYTESEAEAIISLFLEFRDQHGYDEERAKWAAINEVAEGYDASIDMHDKPLPGEEDQPVPLPHGEAVQRRLKTFEDEAPSLRKVTF